MANKQIFSYGNNGKRKIGHSKFDMGHEHIMSSNFGGLLPAACFETLPDDYWDISDNTVTLLKPLTAPAFTRINQNFYGAYVRNQQIWKYWNDYISNGTAFGDVYGNNVTNQSLQNAWDIPSIPTPYLQTILKVGFGNATPVFHYSCSCSAGNPSSSDDPLATLISHNIVYYNPSTTPQRITDAVYALLQVDPSNSSLQKPSVLRQLQSFGFSDYAFDVWFYYDGSKHYYLFELYCSLRQWLTFSSCSLLGVDSSYRSNPSYVGEDLSDSYTPSSGVSVPFRFFADRSSSDPRTSTSAFLIEKTDYVAVDSNVLKSLDFYPRLVDSDVSCVVFKPTASYNFYVYQCFQSSYWGFRYVCRETLVLNDYELLPERYLLDSFDSNTDFYWIIDAKSLFGVSSASVFQSLMESFADKVHYLGPPSFGFSSSLDMFAKTSSLSSPLSVISSSSNTLDYCEGFGSQISAVNPVFANYRVYAACDLLIRFDSSGNTSINGFAPLASFVSRDSLALGYDSVSMFVYLCNQSSILLDSFGLKVDPLSQRPFSDYRFELTNALPFFAYSKVWNDNFRNSVVSSPELDYSESNGLIFANSNFYNNFVFATPSTYWFLEPAQRPSRYVGKVASDFSANGWTLELTTFPRNSQGSAIHTHLPVKNFSNVLTLLTGHFFDYMIQALLSTDLNVFDHYSPSYYNGLIHLKYQNFNKDYFTSALLDPMSGANQVQLGSTVNELRQAEAEQHWWERTAMYRSIKSWFEGTYGITPIELPEDSRITGSDHVDVQIGEVIQTSGSTPESPQGTRSGLGGARGSGTLCHGHCNEHGWILVLVSHTIESQYTQVYDKMWDVKESFLDYPTVDFAGIGNESILQKEVNYTTQPTLFLDYNFLDYASGSNPSIQFLPCQSSSYTRYRGITNPLRKTSSVNGKFNIAKNAGTSLDNIFGFIPRYSSYKFKFDQVSGQFRNELKFWHTFKRYLTSPILCHEFVNWEMAADDDDINRIFAVSDDFLDDKFAIDCFINAHVDRSLPFVCVPSSK